MGLKPFLSYYGGKWRAAPRYPKPIHGTIVEPFAGAAGYSMRYPDRNVVLVEKYPLLAEMWRFLIGATPSDILGIPLVEDVGDLPGSTPSGARVLVGFAMNAACAAPCRRLSAGNKKLSGMGRATAGWTETRRARTANQVEAIKHWKIIEGDYTAAPEVPATWFVDPPYNNKAGSYYVHGGLDYEALGTWCQGLQGQVLVCENEGADWLPFEPFATLKAGVNGSGSREVLYQN